MTPNAPLAEETLSNDIDTQKKSDPAYTRVGVRGVRLKKFEEAVADLLQNNVRPNYVRLPALPTIEESGGSSLSWPFNSIHPCARVRGDGPGQIKGDRACRKEAQLRSMLCCVSAMLQDVDVTNKTARPITVVDFCGGTGHLALPLALLFPKVQVVVVDLKAVSLKLLHEKALLCCSSDTAGTNISREKHASLDNEFYRKGSDLTKHERLKRQCAGIPNLFTFHGSIETFQDNFDIGVALHACGEASDVVLRTCAAVKANFCVSPCCVGKLHRQRRNPYVYHATAGNLPSIGEYPQSRVVNAIVDTPHWDDLCRAADYGELQELRTPRNATRRTAKALLETDRLLYMQEAYGYQTALTRMVPWECSPKNDILLGWHPDNHRVSAPFRNICMENDPECNADIERAHHDLLLSGDSSTMEEDCVDWTRQEEQEVRAVLEEFVRDELQKQYVFPTGMGARKRKLIHFVAEQLGLAHWGVGRSYATKAVTVEKRRAKKEG